MNEDSEIWNGYIYIEQWWYTLQRFPVRTEYEAFEAMKKTTQFRSYLCAPLAVYCNDTLVYCRDCSPDLLNQLNRWVMQ